MPMPVNKRLAAAVFAATCTTLVGFEGLYLKPYRDIAGVLTRCIGDTGEDGTPFKPEYTEGECRAMLIKALPKYYDGMAACINRELPQGMQVAFLSATYNIGIKGFCGSSMARRANAGDLVGACDALLLWDKARTSTGFRPVKGLTNRRKAERKICLEGLT